MILDELRQLVESKRASYCRCLKSTAKNYRQKYGHLYDYIIENTKILNDPIYTLKTKVYWVLNGIKSFNDERCCCKYCGKNGENRNVKNIFIGYHNYCSTKCMHSSPLVKDLCEKTCLEKYGAKNVSQSEEIKDKKVKTYLRKYGVDNPAKAKEVKEKTIKTCLEKYGTKFTFSSAAIKEKCVKTIFQRYGVEHPLQNVNLKLKAKQKYVFKNLNFDSKPELILYIYLSDNSINFEYQPNIKFEYEFEGKTHFYIPDFKINDKIYEIKGNHFFKDDGTMQNPFCHEQDGLYEAKHQCMLKNNVKIILCDDILLKTAKQYVKDKYTLKYLEQFKKR